MSKSFSNFTVVSIEYLGTSLMVYLDLGGDLREWIWSYLRGKCGSLNWDC